MGICWTTIVNALQQSERLLDATLRSYEQAIGQIKERRYWEKVSEYTGDILLVGISYDKDAKAHQCKIESLA